MNKYLISNNEPFYASSANVCKKILTQHYFLNFFLKFDIAGHWERRKYVSSGHRLRG